jgi:hypothetical protein
VLTEFAFPFIESSVLTIRREDAMHAKDSLVVLALSAAITLGLIVGCAQLPAATAGPTDAQAAQDALNLFFSLLQDQRYSEAVNYYGGDYDVLRIWNPAAVDDNAELFKSACSLRLRCLRIKAMLRGEEVSPTEFRFVVQFMDDDGTVFRHGPCCGGDETETPAQTEFSYTVKKVGGRFLVQEMPIVLP